MTNNLRNPVITLAYVANNPKLVEIIRIVTEHNLTPRRLALEVGVTPTTLDYWLKTPSANIRDSAKIDKLLELCRQKHQELSTLEKSSRQSDTKTPYNTSLANLDSAQLQQLHSLTEKVQIEVQVTPVDKPWSAKGVQTKMASSSAFPGAAGRPIQVDGALGDNILPGQVVIFRPKEDDYIVEDLYMIFEHKDDADQSVIGWFDPQKDSRMIQTMGGPLPVGEWKATHEAFAVMWGKFGELTEYRISTKGIGPATRL